MIRRSGVSPAVTLSKASRVTPRRAASGHRPSTQLRKFAAEARIASAAISGWPEDPDSPLHSGAGADAEAGAEAGAWTFWAAGALAGATAAGGLIEPVDPPKIESNLSPTDCPKLGAAAAALSRATAPQSATVRDKVTISSAFGPRFECNSPSYGSANRSV